MLSQDSHGIYQTFLALPAYDGMLETLTVLIPSPHAFAYL